MGTLRVRKTAKGKTVYDAEVRRKGHPRTCHTFQRLTDARAWIQEMEVRVRAGVPTVTAEAERHTFTEAVERYFREGCADRLASADDLRRHVEWFNKHLSSKTLAEISPALLTEIKARFLKEPGRRKQVRKPQTWNRYLSALSVVLEACVKDWQWLEHNPTRRVRREREAPGRVRFLSDDERQRLLEACRSSRSPNLYPAVVLTLSTGMRHGEVRYLTWSQVDLAKGAIILTKTKNKECRRVPARGLALELLRQHARVRRIGNHHVFPGEQNAEDGGAFHLDRFWYPALKAAGIENFRFHDLRHSAASELAMNGASLLEIAEILGHKTLQMVKRYSHLAESHTAAVVEAMNRRIFGV